MQLKLLRKDAENLRTRIIDALACSHHRRDTASRPMRLNGVDADMLTVDRRATSPSCWATSTARSSRPDATRRTTHARPTAMGSGTSCWRSGANIGGKPTGMAAASFLIAASKPVCAAQSRPSSRSCNGLNVASDKAAKRLRRRDKPGELRPAYKQDRVFPIFVCRDLDKQARSCVSKVTANAGNDRLLGRSRNVRSDRC